MVTVELKPGGAEVPVTEDNKKEYVNCVVEYRISRRVKEQFEAFMSGFSELIPQDLINVFDERELELLIGGMSEIDVCVLSSFDQQLNPDLYFVAMTGPNSLIIVDMRSTTMWYSGSGSACVAGRQSASLASCSLPRVPRVSRSTDSRTCRALMDLVDSRSRSLEILASYRRVTPVSIVSTYLHTRTTPPWNRSLRSQSSKHFLV